MSEPTAPTPPAQSQPESPSEVPPTAGSAENLRNSAAARERWKVVALRWLKRASVFIGVILVLSALGVVATVRYYEAGLPSVEDLRRGYDPPQVTRVLARDGSLLANLFTERRTVIPLSEVPGHAKLAFLAAEDASFYEHEGLDYLGMLRALYANLRAGKTVQGGSTITQQVVKNLLLDPERTYRRKIRETILARRLEQHLDKDEIFGLYLNHIYLGHGRYGVEEAARYYFGKKARDLTLAEAAQLAGIVASPERLSPRRAPEKALKRRAYVLGQMLEKGFVTPELFKDARDAPLRLAPAVEAESELCPEVIALARRTLESVAGERANKGGYSITTSIDPTLQAQAREAVRENLDAYMKRQKLAAPFTLKKRRLWGPPFEGTPKAHHIYVGEVVALDDQKRTIDVQVGDSLGRVELAREERFNPTRVPPSEFVEKGASLRVGLMAEPGGDEPVPLRLELGPQSALVAVEPRSREVRALVGSYEAIPGGLDRATRALRQPGSAFKPFLYAYALKSRRVTPATLLSLPASKNGKTEARELRVRTAIAKSDNAAAEQLLDRVGAAGVVQFARGAGIESPLEPTPSLALGAYEVRPIELANAYATIASGGLYASPVLVTKIVAPDGKELPLPDRLPERRVMSEEEAFLITSLMKSVVQEGTARRATVLGRPVAGKTGTTNQAKDAWFVGFSPELVASVWVGYDDALPLGWGESGAVSALPAWIDFIKASHSGRPKIDFARPPTITAVKIDPATGLLSHADQEDALEELFLPGTEPSELAPLDAGVVESAGDGGVEETLDLEAVQASASGVGSDAGVDAGVPPTAAITPAEELPPF